MTAPSHDMLQTMARLTELAVEGKLDAVVFITTPDSDAQAQVGAAGDPDAAAVACRHMLGHIKKTTAPVATSSTGKNGAMH